MVLFFDFGVSRYILLGWSKRYPQALQAARSVHYYHHFFSSTSLYSAQLLNTRDTPDIDLIEIKLSDLLLSLLFSQKGLSQGSEILNGLLSNKNVGNPLPFLYVFVVQKKGGNFQQLSQGSETLYEPNNIRGRIFKSCHRHFANKF